MSVNTVPSLYCILGPQYYKHPNITTGRTEIFEGCRLLTPNIRKGQEKQTMFAVSGVSGYLQWAWSVDQHTGK